MDEQWVIIPVWSRDRAYWLIVQKYGTAQKAVFALGSFPRYKEVTNGEFQDRMTILRVKQIVLELFQY